jgi:hypothetical protein
MAKGNDDASARAVALARESDRRKKCCITQKLVLISTPLPGKPRSVLVKGRFKFWLMDGLAIPHTVAPSSNSKKNKGRNREINIHFIPALVNDNYSAKIGPFSCCRPRVISNLANHLASAFKGMQQAADSTVIPAHEGA